MDKFYTVEEHGNCCNKLYLSGANMRIAQTVMKWTDDEMVRKYVKGFSREEAQEICRESSVQG